MKNKNIELSVLDNIDKYEVGSYLIDILENEFGFEKKFIIKKIKENRKENFVIDEIIDLFNVDKKEVQYKIREKVKSAFGDSSNLEWWFNYYKIPLNDRRKVFQLFIKYSSLYFKEEPEAKITFEDLEKNISNIQYFNIEQTLAEVLNKTDSKKTEIPFDNFFIDTNVLIKGRRYLGILVFNAQDDKTKELLRKQIIGFYITKKKNTDTIGLAYGFDELDGQTKEVTNFIYSFANFLNEREVILKEKPFNEKNNLRRKQKGRTQLPRENIIRITGELYKYIESLKEKNYENCSCSFWIRGHFFHFRNKDVWTGIYKMSEEELREKNYIRKDGLIRFWKKPSIAGRGELKKSIYILK